LKHKSEAFVEFQEFNALVEKESRKCMKNLHIGNTKEYTKNEFLTYLSKHSINHQRIVPYTPQQNGFLVRKRRTLVEMARCMLHSIGLDKIFWVEVICCTNYILKRVPTKTILQVNLQQNWSGRRTCVKNFKVFCCKC
jgi:hypothetical protein